MATSYLFKLNNVSVNVEVAPKIIETQDETFDSATCVLEANTDKYPVKPMTTFQVIATYDDESTENFDFYVTADNVELYSTEPLRYKHTLSLIQSSQRTNKILIRNSVFSQPAQKVKKAFWSIGQYESYAEYEDDDENFYIELSPLPGMCRQGYASLPLKLNTREKIKGCPYIVITYQCGLTIDNEYVSDIVENKPLDILQSMLVGQKYPLWFGNANVVGKIYYKNANNVDSEEWLTLSDIVGGKILFNQPLYIPKIKTILENGGNNIYVSTVKQTRTGFHHSGDLDFNNLVWDTYASPFKCKVGNAIEELRVYRPAGKHFAFINTQIQLCVETYYWSAWDILEKINQRYRQTSVLGNKRQPLYTLNPTSYTGELLKKTVAPNFAFTQCSLFECLSEIFRLYDATFKLKNYDEVEIEYLNSSANETDSLDFSGETRTINNDRYNSGIISYYQDARVKEFFPSKTGFANATSMELGVPAETDHVFLLSHKIDNIVSARAKILKCIVPTQRRSNLDHYGTEGGITCELPFSVDITSYLVDEEIWSALPSSSSLPYNDDYKEVAQTNSIYYKKDTNIIDVAYSYKIGWVGITYDAFTQMLKSAFFKSSSIDHNVRIPIGQGASVAVPWDTSFFALNDPDVKDWKNFYIQVEYETSVDGRVKNESIVNKYDGEMLIDQYNGAVDLAKMGLNMLGLSLKLGEPTLNATHKITTLQNRIKKGTIYIDGSGKRWVANVCSYTILDNDYILGEISFTANYNALSLRTKLNRERRMTNISSDLITKSEDNYVDYIYYSSHSFSESAENIALHLNQNTSILWSFFPCINPDDGESTLDLSKVPNVAGINLKRTDGYPLIPYTFVYTPLVRYASGNSLCFEISYESPNTTTNRTLMQEGWWGSELKYFTKPVKYTDDLGFNDITSIGFFNSSKVSFDMTVVVQSTPTQIIYPEAVGTDMPLILLDTYQLYKQPNEIFALNYQLCFLPKETEKDTIFLGRSFFENNFLVNDDVGLHEFYIVYGDGKYDILDTELIDNEDRFLMDTISVATETNGFVIRFGHVEEDVPSGATCWALVDENDNIYIMSNEVLDERYQEIHLLPRKTRL